MQPSYYLVCKPITSWCATQLLAGMQTNY